MVDIEAESSLMYPPISKESVNKSQIVYDENNYSTKQPKSRYDSIEYKAKIPIVARKKPLRRSINVDKFGNTHSSGFQVSEMSSLGKTTTTNFNKVGIKGSVPLKP